MTGSKATLKTEFNMYHNTKDSDYIKVMSGVPQGSILGPLLCISNYNRASDVCMYHMC